MKVKLALAMALVMSGCASGDAFAKGASCQAPLRLRAVLSPAGAVVLNASSCEGASQTQQIDLELTVGGRVVQRESMTGEGLAALSVDRSLDLDGDGVADIGFADGSGKAGDGMTYWLLKMSPPRLEKAGSAPRLSVSTDGQRALYALVPGSGDVQATRIHYVVQQGRLQPAYALQFVPVGDAEVELRELSYQGAAAEQPWSEMRRWRARPSQAQQCMEGGACGH